jgi:peroxiredoxin (alkyl hydroperoxide reductase subunit C)
VLEPGTPAIDFTLKDQNNEEFTLSEHRGSKAVLVVFYPFAFTGICTGELNAIREDLAFFSNDAVTTVTVSCDTVYAQIFAETVRLPRCCPISGRTARGTCLQCSASR